MAHVHCLTKTKNRPHQAHCVRYPKSGHVRILDNLGKPWYCDEM
jgi:hypothetical protein